MATEVHVIVGPPGCGKTHTIAHQVERAIDAGYHPTDVDVRSLTRTAAREAAGRIDLPDGCVGTLHSAAFRALGLTREQVVGSKNIGQFNDEHPEYAISGARSDTDDSFPVERFAVKTMGDLQLARMDILRSRNLPRTEWPADVQEFGEAWFGWLGEADLVDFTGMLEQALANTYAMPGTPAIMFVDEAQDLSALGFALVKQWAQHAQKLLVVGDPCQCLFEWAGADPEDLMAFSSNVHVLKQSYRIPREVHRRATTIAQTMLDRWRIEFAPRDADGEAVSGGQPEAIVSLAREADDAMILASCGYMLTPIIAELRRLGVPFYNPWRTTRGDWNPLRGGADKVLDFLAGDQRDIADMTWLRDLQAGAFARGTKARLNRKEVDTPRDFASWVALFATEGDAIKALGERDTSWLLENIDPKKSKAYQYAVAIADAGGVRALKARPKICVGTVHSVKGGQADAVFLLPDLSAQGYEEWRMKGSRGTEAVERVFYVGATRAKERLVLCNSHSHRRFAWD